MIWNRRKDGRRERRKSLELSSSIAKTAETTKRKERKRRNEEKKLIREKRKNIFQESSPNFRFILSKRTEKNRWQRLQRTESENVKKQFHKPNRQRKERNWRFLTPLYAMKKLFSFVIFIFTFSLRTTQIGTTFYHWDVSDLNCFFLANSYQLLEHNLEVLKVFNALIKRLFGRLSLKGKIFFFNIEKLLKQITCIDLSGQISCRHRFVVRLWTRTSVGRQP